MNYEIIKKSFVYLPLIYRGVVVKSTKIDEKNKDIQHNYGVGRLSTPSDACCL